MPLHGKIVVIKRSGGDGTEFPLTATCLFGRKPDCDIRIQLPQVSKEHCRIDLNENKEVVLTNLSSVNPTRVNGEALQQSERLKHGDVITIIDRSFRFEYPPAPTPKKRSSTGGKKAETLKVLQDQQVSTAVTAEQGEKRVSDVFADGTNHDNIQRSLEKTMEMDSTEDGSLLQEKSSSPFGDLYQMIKKSLDVKTPRKSSISFLQTPSSKFCTPKPVSVRKNDGKPVGVTEDRSTPKKDEAKVVPGADETKESVESVASEAPKSVKKQRRSSQVVCETPGPAAEEAKLVSPKRSRLTPQRFSVSEVIEQVAVQTPKSPVRRRSKEASPAKPEQEEKTKTTPKTEQQKRTSPRNSGKAEKAKEVSKKRKSGELADDLPTSQMKRKRVSFGGFLAPELFDKRLPPDSPLCKGATPRRSMGNLTKPKQSLLRRASVTGFLAFDGSPSKMRTPSPKKSSSKNASPKTPTSGKKSPKSRSPSPKAASPAKKSPKARTPSPKKASSPKKSPKSRSPSPAKKTPKARTTSPKAASPGKKSPAAGKSPSIKETPTGKKSSASPQGKAPTPAKTPLNSRISTPTVQGRFSVSRINTPSPVSDDVVPDQMLSVTVTPKIPLRRKSMKSASRKTPSISKSAAKVIRRSGISRASIKIKSFADIVKFGQAKAAVAAPAKKMVVKTTKKKTTMSKLKTPAKNLKDHVSTGHANSPVTIVVGRAHKQTVVYPTGAAPKVVANIALLKKNMKMDEDLTGISEMFKTPVNERKRRSVSAETSAVKTPVNALSTSVVEPSVLSTPEEPGEMIVSPMSVTSAVKGTRYNSEAVQRLLDADQESSFISDTPVPEIDLNESNDQQGTDVGTPVSTPKQKPEKPDCLTGVKRIMKTPRQKAEPVEDLRGKLLKTPKQKPEQRECLTGVKRMMKTPKQKAEPIEDLRGKILKTPKQKMEQKECLTGVKRIMKTPKQKAEAVEDIRGKLLVTPKQKPEQQECLSGVKRIFKTPQREVEPVEDVLKTPKASEAGDVILETSADVQESETTNVENAPVLCVTDVKRVMKMPKEKSAPVEDMVGVKRLMKTPKQKAEPVEDNFGIKKLMRSPRLRGIAPVEDFEGLSELMEEPLTKPAGQMETDETKDVSSDHDNKSPESMETISQEAVDVSLQVEQPKVDPVDAAAEPDHEKKPVRGRRGKAAESKAAQDKQEPAEASEEPVAPPPARGRRGKKTEAASSTAVRQTTRTRGKDVELTIDESTPRPRRGRNAKKASDDQPETTSEVATETHTEPEAEHEQIPAVNVDHKANDSEAPQETTVSKPRRGRKAKPASEQSQDVPSAHVDDIPPADVPKDANEVCSEQLEPVPSTIVENVSSHAVETVAEAPVTESLPEVGTQTCRITEMDAAVQKKPVRGRRGKMAEPKAAEDKQDCSEDPVVPAPVRGRRGKKTEAAAAPAVKQTARTRNARSQETTTADEPKMVQESSVETQAEPEISTEAVSDQTSMINASQEKNDSAAPAEEAIVKTTRGRKTKMPVETPEPEKNESVSEESLKAETIVEKPRRGRKAKTDVEQNEIAEDVVAVETKQQSQPPVRAKRGRNAKQQENDGETSAPTTQEPVKKARRTRKAEPEQVEAKEEMQTTEIVVPEEPEAAPEPVKVNEPVTATAKPRRGGRKAKQDAESETPAESTEVQEVPVVSSTDKPKRGRKGKQVTAEVEVTPEEPKPEAEEEKNAEPEPPVKATRAKGKSSARNEVSQAKRARRGAAAAVEETTAESVVEVSESAPAPVEAPKRGRRKAAEPTTVSSDQAAPSEDTSSAVVEDAKTSKRSVKWKENLEVFQIPKETPVKAVRGRKSKLQVQAEAESKNVSKDASKTEENDLSEETVEVQPVKRARRGAKMADEAESSSKAAETESQPKTRRGRPAKK